MTRRATAGLLAVFAFALAGCAPVSGTTIPQVSADVPAPAGAAEVTSPPPAPVQSCPNLLASRRPPSPMPAPGQMPAGSTMAKIVQYGKLRVGVDQNTYNVGFRDPLNGRIQGFDIDMAHAIAKALFGDPDKIELHAITSAQRIPMLQSGEIDIVVRTMSITCDRLQQVDFSAVYYDAKQRILVKTNSAIQGAADLGGKRVCATNGSTSLSRIAALAAKPVAIGVPDWTDCLVMLQQGQVDAVSTDDVILAGMAAQDPYTRVVGDPLADEPYGIAIPQHKEDFVRFVNGVLAEIEADGTWTAAYQRWLGSLLPGAAPAPPAPQYRD
ncbi:MAG TPA: transporter substrate-binding domain-containing protein [Amycolatopsis sp.]|uniref:glutamate ABC transporter substrate-binding protein n=1 Tax=Amycolatopsis sp. TaxID=37632 RepID=UPI002B46FBE7|nr:transporter substrate-binding domain-containing protein [Amycolatopsis sp.]HKS46510.1 transporter substrate-binding domain-containing protein [Amycolatopsis sp.]